MLTQTPNGTRYLTAPEAVIVAATRWAYADTHIQESFIDPLFPYTDDDSAYFNDGDVPDDGAQLAKFAGQLCYLSFGAQRTRNSEAAKYLDHIKASGHGSVFEHVNYSILLWGVSRAFTHELVRHRAGFGFSQISQRYVAGKHVRFVESPAHSFYPELHVAFESWIDLCAAQYEHRERVLLRVSGIDPAKATTEQRKAVRQEARRSLPNETEAPVLVTGNLRAWRHMIEQRASRFADAEICAAAYLCFEKLRAHEPILWEDYTVETVREDGLPTVQTPYRKV
ncbi:MAG: FAD-dependent thymidylate synthase [Rhodospirillaceae bacterium]